MMITFVRPRVERGGYAVQWLSIRSAIGRGYGEGLYRLEGRKEATLVRERNSSSLCSLYPPLCLSLVASVSPD